MRRLFDLWKNTPAVESPLENNQDLKSVMLEETPWLREGMEEGETGRASRTARDGHPTDRRGARVGFPGPFCG